MEPSAPIELRPVSDVASVVDGVLVELRAELARVAPGVSVEHVGATSHATSTTKGDVDVSLRVAQHEFDRVVASLKSRYAIAQAQNWTATYASFSAERALPVGIQLAVINSPDDFLVPLRDLFTGRPDLLNAYDSCKRDAASLGALRYWEAKDAFLRDLLAEHLPTARPAQT